MTEIQPSWPVTNYDYFFVWQYRLNQTSITCRVLAIDCTICKRCRSTFAGLAKSSQISLHCLLWKVISFTHYRIGIQRLTAIFT